MIQIALPLEMVFDDWMVWVGVVPLGPVDGGLRVVCLPSDLGSV